MSEICKKHTEKPVKIYCKCIGCEVENLRQQVKELQELLEWHKARHRIDQTT